DMLENPGELGGRKVWVQAQPGLLDDFLFVPGVLELPARRRRAAILPDNGVVDRNAGTSIPEQCCFALVGESDRCDMPPFGTQTPQYLTRCRQGRRPDDLWVMFHPARSGVYLLEGMLVERDNGTARREGDAAAGAGPLIDGKKDRVVAAHAQ